MGTNAKAGHAAYAVAPTGASGDEPASADDAILQHLAAVCAHTEVPANAAEENLAFVAGIVGGGVDPEDPHGPPALDLPDDPVEGYGVFSAAVATALAAESQLSDTAAGPYQQQLQVLSAEYLAGLTPEELEAVATASGFDNPSLVGFTGQAPHPLAVWLDPSVPADAEAKKKIQALAQARHDALCVGQEINGKTLGQWDFAKTSPSLPEGFDSWPATEADLAEVLIGWLLIDLGYRGEGQQYLLAALREAARIGDRALGAYILSCLGYDLMWHGDARDALRVIGIARMGARDGATGAVGALMATRMARAYAHLGEDAKCRKAIEEAAQLISASAISASPDWCKWVTPAVLEADAGRAYLDLGNASQAEGQLSAGLGNLDRKQRRNRLLHHTSVAQARLALGQVDGAAHAVHAALSLKGSVESGRARYRLEDLMGRFAEYNAVSAREARDVIRQFLVRAPFSA